MIRSLVRWARTLPGNLASLRLYGDLRWRVAGIGVGIDPGFDPGDAHYWFHFSYFYIWLHLFVFVVEFGIHDSN